MMESHLEKHLNAGIQLLSYLNCKYKEEWVLLDGDACLDIEGAVRMS
jgi:hypothetical protein